MTAFMKVHWRNVLLFWRIVNVCSLCNDKKSHRILNILTPDGPMDINFIENVEIEVIDRPRMVNEVMNLYKHDKLLGTYKINSLDKHGLVGMAPYDSDVAYTMVEISLIV